MRIELPKPIADIVQSPSWPGSIERPSRRAPLGVDYDTQWSRSPVAAVARELLVDNVTRPLARIVASPKIFGEENLNAIDGPVIFTANHTSHLDTAILLSSLPKRFRDKTVVAAAADYFFDRRWKATMWSLALGTIPIERTRVNRKSVNLAAELIGEGWNLIIFPEGGRSPDGWGQEFGGGAAYLAKRCSVPVVPTHLRGVRPIFPKGSNRLKPGIVEIRFGKPLLALEAEGGGRGEEPRKFSLRIEAAVAVLGDEAETDWWSARQRAAHDETPAFRGPVAAPWRRAWSLPESARRDAVATKRSRRKPW